MSIRYDGQYCGPGWSGGHYQDSIRYGDGPPATSAFDETCREHDGIYWAVKNKKRPGSDLDRADSKFIKLNLGKGFKRTAAALAVMAQRSLRKKKIMAITRSNRTGRGRTATRRNPTTPRRTPRTPMQQLAAVMHDPNNNNTANDNMMLEYNRAHSRSASRPRAVSTSHSATITKGGAATGTGVTGIKSNKNTKKTKSPSYIKDGSVKQIQRSTLVTASLDKSTLYIGGGTPLSEMLNAFSRALLSLMFRKIGMYVLNWDDYISTNGVYLVRLFYTPTTTATAVTMDEPTVAGTTTWDAMATALAARIRLLLTAESEGQFTSAQVYIYADLASANPVKLVDVPLDQVELEWRTDTALTIQNSTLAGDGSSVETSTTDNPLEGRCYWINGTKAEHAGRYRNTDPLGFLLTPDTTGIVSNDIVASALPVFSSPVNGKIFRRLIKQEKIIATPGQMIRRSAVREQSMCWNDALYGLGQSANATAASGWSRTIGQMVFFGLEKMLDSDTAIPKVGLEVVFKISCCASIKKSQAAPMIIEKA